MERRLSDLKAKSPRQSKFLIQWIMVNLTLLTEKDSPIDLVFHFASDFPNPLLLKKCLSTTIGTMKADIVLFLKISPFERFLIFKRKSVNAFSTVSRFSSSPFGSSYCIASAIFSIRVALSFKLGFLPTSFWCTRKI